MACIGADAMLYFGITGTQSEVAISRTFADSPINSCGSCPVFGQDKLICKPNGAEKLSLAKPIVSTMRRSSSSLFLDVSASDIIDSKNGFVRFCHLPVPSRAPRPGLLKPIEFNITPRSGFILTHPENGLRGV